MHRFVFLCIRPEFCVIIALSLFILPVEWIVGWLIAAGIHELSHILMIRILRIRILSISLKASGAVIESEPMTPFQELLCALAGPIGGLSSIFLIRLSPHIALCAAVQSIYNLLPVFPLDGGRVVKCAVACLWGEENAVRISKATTIVVFILILFTVVMLSYRYQHGLLTILFPVMPLMYCVHKNSLQSRKNNCTIAPCISNSERTIR